MKHDFHFVLNKELKNQIKSYAKLKNMKLSETVIYIFYFMKPVLEKHYFKDAMCKSGKYKLIDADIDIHVYFEKVDYKYLRQVQSNLYCFSMALVIRWVLIEFFKGINKYGENRYGDVVRRFARKWLKSMRNNCTRIFKKRHLFSCIQNFQYIHHKFDKEYNLINTKFT